MTKRLLFCFLLAVLSWPVISQAYGRTIDYRQLSSIASAGNDTSICISSPDFNLSGLPAGGTWSGQGITNPSTGTFSAAQAGLGVVDVVYAFTDAMQLTTFDTLRITILDLPQINMDTLAAVCLNSDSIALAVATPVGGVYSGPGVRNGFFFPASAGVGTHFIRYSFTNAQTGCTNVDSISITVRAVPTLLFPALGTVCISNAGFELTTATPSGGTYSGPGVNNNQFLPQQAGVGTFTITYTFLDTLTACSNSVSSTITVNNVPIVSLNALNAVCVNTAPFQLSGGSPAGGTFSGAGVSNGQFSPFAAGAGTHVITYAFTHPQTGCEGMATQNIVVSPGPGTSLTAQNSTTFCTGRNVTLQASADTGSTFVWLRNGQIIPGVIGNSFTASEPGNYQVVGTKTASGCSDSSLLVAISINPLPGAAITAAGATTFCQGGSVVLNATPATGMGYVWLRNGVVVSGQTTASLTATLAGSYRVIVTNTATQCFDTSAATTVTVNPLPGAAITAVGATTFCQGGSVVLNATPATGMGYVWLRNGAVVTGQTTASLTATLAGSYRVIVTNTATQCFDTSAATTVTVNPLPGAAITAAGATTFCQGGSVVLNATPATGMGYVWLRNGAVVTGQTFASLTATLAGSYRVIVTNTATQCFDTSAATTVTVNPLPGAAITAAGATTFCQGGSVVLNATPASGMGYVWLRNGAVVTGQTSASLTATLAGVYRVIVTNTATQCFDTSAATTVTVNQLPGAAITAAGATTFCQGGSVVLNATPATGMGYVWLRNGAVVNGQTSASLTATQAGSYRVIVTNTATQCFDTSAATTVTVNQLPGAAITAAGATTFCQGGSVVLNATPATGMGYVWLRNGAVVTGQTSASLTATLAGVYRVIVTNTATQCFDTSAATTVTVNVRPAAAVITVNGTSDTLFSSVATGNQWFRNGAAITGATNQSLAITQNGSYQVVVTDGNGCASDSSNVLNILNVSVAGQTFSYLNLYPNPTTGKAWLEVALPGFEEVRVEVTSSTGQRVQLEWLPAATGALQYELQLPDLANGIYLVRVQQGEYVGVKRLFYKGE